MSYVREVDEKERMYLAEIGARGGKSRSHKKLDAVTHNLVLAMRARFPKDPKWNPDLRGGKKGTKGKVAKKVAKKKALKLVKPLKKGFPKKFTNRKFAAANVAISKKKGKKMSEIESTPSTSTSEVKNPTCFVCHQPINLVTEAVIQKRNPSTHRKAPAHSGCQPLKASK